MQPPTYCDAVLTRHLAYTKTLIKLVEVYCYTQNYKHALRAIQWRAQWTNRGTLLKHWYAIC